MTRILLISALLCCFRPCPAAAAAAVRLALHWLPQAQFAGFYMAQDKGFYRDAGIDLTVLHGGTDSVPADRLSSGEAHFATMFLAAALERRAAGIPLVNICQLSQRTSLMLLTRKEDNIASVADLAGRRVAVWANEFQLQTWGLFRQHGISVSLVPFSGSMELFLKGAVSAALAMWYNEYHSVLASGYREEELHPLFFKDTDFDFPEDGLYCLAKTIEEHPDTVDAFIEATKQGWHYAFTHQEEALAVTERHMRAANLPFSAAHQRWMLRTMATLMQPDSDSGTFGTLPRPAFERVARALTEAGFTDRLPPYETFVRSVADAD
ncbi:MAG: ABC transporter substrate-binding protein [Desulfofustis sp.]|jgi:NitT/TauT family transport system substrate-binding protein|nr:ABC transporter substrate-binding protein [Desulfofustis sp.]